MRVVKLSCFIALALWLLVLSFQRHLVLEANLPYEEGFQFEPPATTDMASHPISLRELSRQDIPMPADTPAAHASFLLADKDGGLRAFWFAGERESGEDVQIWMSAKPSAAGVWSQPVVAVNRHEACEAMGCFLGGFLSGHAIRRLGNPVAWMDAQGRTHLYVVATTWLGGWAASRVLHLRQEVDTSSAFKPVGFLPLSPLFNVSHLVRGAPVPMADGGVLLPAYFELGVKYPLAIRLNVNGELVPSRDAVMRMAGNLKSLQPSVAVTSEQNATTYLRDNSVDQKLRFALTTDGGKTWRNMASSQGTVGEAGADFVINPDSSPTAVRIGGQTLLIHNPQTSGRHRLVIESSVSGLRGFKRLATLEYEPPSLEGVQFNEYSYPSAILIGNKLHVSYTYQKRLIRHVILQVEAAK